MSELRGNGAILLDAIVLDEDQCWKVLQQRNKRLPGTFFYGVLSTGVFCRPGCPSRLPRRANVRFYVLAADAAKDGLRPCLRCKPLSDQGTEPAMMQSICEYIEQHADSPLLLADLAGRAKLTIFHFQRKFKAAVGVSPKQYLDHCRLRKFKSIVRESKPQGVTGALYEAGFGASSRLYEKADTRLGMTPMEYRDGGKGVDIAFVLAETPLGLMMVGATERGLCSVQFGDKAEQLETMLRTEYPRANIQPMPDPAPVEFRHWIDALNRHLAGRTTDLRLPLHVRATAFQMQVWKYLQSIPQGSVASYKEVAAGIGRPGAARAVARACASNCVALAIPCHRVIRGSGELGGYKWGIERKRVLVDIERRGRRDSAAGQTLTPLR